MTFSEIVSEAKRLEAESAKQFGSVEDHEWAEFCRLYIGDLIIGISGMQNEDGGLVDQFIQYLNAELNRLGIDTSSCDGEEAPHIIIAGWIAGRIKNAEEDRDSALARAEELERKIDIIETEWERQKNLFPVLSKDGWMDSVIADAKRLTPSPAREHIQTQAKWKFVPSHDNPLTGSAVPDCWVSEDGEVAWENPSAVQTQAGEIAKEGQIIHRLTHGEPTGWPDQFLMWEAWDEEEAEAGEISEKGGDAICAQTTKVNAPAAKTGQTNTVQDTDASAPSCSASNTRPDGPTPSGAGLLPFDLAKALAGAKVVTRDGREARDLKPNTDQDTMSQCPWRATIFNKILLRDSEFSFTEKGEWRRGSTSPLDLFLAPPEDGR